MKRCVLAIAAVALSGASRARAQAQTDSARCDSIVGAKVAVVDSVRTVVFVWVAEIRGYQMTNEQRDLIESRIARAFVPPSPFALSVFEGPALAGALRVSSGADTLGVPRGASISGTYRIEVTESGAVSEPEVVRSSLMRGLDSALIRAIRAAAKVGTAFRPVSGDRWRLEIRVGGDSANGARALAQGTFPRMRVRDATPVSKQRPAFPEDARGDSLDHGEVVLRFVVDRDGAAALETVELVRAASLPFARAALAALAAQRFNPATIRGCPVAQVVEYPFVFDDTERPPPRAP